MRMLHCIKKHWIAILAGIVMSVSLAVHAETTPVKEDNLTIDRVKLVSHQISLLKNRIVQAERELAGLQVQHDKETTEISLDKTSKGYLEKASLDIAVAKSNLDSITIELTDSQQTINWLEKNSQEIENQLNVLGIFGVKVAKNAMTNMEELRTDLAYQKKLVVLEKSRASYLSQLQNLANTNLQLRNDKYNRLNTLLKSKRMMHIKQKQVKDELAYQEQQNFWLMQLDTLYTQLAKTNPTKAKKAYVLLERDIFYANESANFAYVQSLIARYKDQIRQMKIAVVKNNSISLLNEISDQAQLLTKQVNKLDAVLKSRTGVLNKQIAYLTQRSKEEEQVKPYLIKLQGLQEQYVVSDRTLIHMNKNILAFRQVVEKALQTELSSRQGLPNFGLKTWLDLGKEMLLVPTLAFQVVKSLSVQLVKAIEAAHFITWTLFAVLEGAWIATLFFVHKLLSNVLVRPSAWRDRINSKWLSLQWLRRNFLDLALLGNILGVMFFFSVPTQHYTFIIYLSLVWLIFKGILTVARVCLVETTHDTSGHDMRLYRRLKWMIIIGGLITALTVFAHQLPLIYELKTLFDRLFLLLLMFVSLLLLRSWDVVPNLVLSHMESQHPYLRKSIRLIGILIPLLMFGNSVIGLFGFLNLIMSVSWYEGIFLLVLIAYLLLRGLLSDGMEQMSRVMIQYVNNGWLWTEAFLKPLDKVLRITLFLMAWGMLFLFYGWDKQSPIVERLTRLLHYNIITILNTNITPLNIIELFVVISIFYWTAKWTREFVFRLLLSRTKDMGLRNSIAILSQYSVVILGVFICLRVLGIDLNALTVVAGAFAFGVGLGLRDLANNFACGFLILLERPLRVGDIVSINGIEGDVTHIGSRAVTVRTWDCMELVVPNAEIFNKPFTNWTAKDNIVRTVLNIKIGRYDNPHEVKLIIQQVLTSLKEILKDPAHEVFLKNINDTSMEFELRYFVNIRQVPSRISVASTALMSIWDAFGQHGIKPPFPQYEVFVKNGLASMAPMELVNQAEKAG